MNHSGENTGKKESDICSFSDDEEILNEPFEKI